MQIGKITEKTTIIKQSIHSLPETVKMHIDSMSNKITDSSENHFLCITSDTENENKFLQSLNIFKIKYSHFNFNILENKTTQELDSFFKILRRPKNDEPKRFIYA